MLAEKASQGLDWVFISPAGGYGGMGGRAPRDGYSSVTSLSACSAVQRGLVWPPDRLA
jgi:hypothetical protein